MKPINYTIDATGKTLGRVASEAAKLLRGKGTADFERHLFPKAKVTIQNARQAKILQKKLKETTYHSHTGHPGGSREETMAGLAERKGYKELFRRAVKGMLPTNKLKPIIMKNLIVEE